jgi:hypothetical protein
MAWWWAIDQRAYLVIGAIEAYPTPVNLAVNLLTSFAAALGGCNLAPSLELGLSNIFSWRVAYRTQLLRIPDELGWVPEVRRHPIPLSRKRMALSGQST